MPYSGNDFDELLKLKLHELHPGRVFDIGIGAGKIGHMVREIMPQSYIAGIEVEGSYSKRFDWTAYDHTYIGEVLAWSAAHPTERFDLVVAGDVIEHLWYHEVRSLFGFWLERTHWLIAIWPTGYPQDDHEGVSSEVHKCAPTLASFVDLDVRAYEKRDRLVGVPGQKHLILLKGSL